MFSAPHVYLSLERFLLSRTKQECAPMFTPVSEFSAHTSLASSHWGVKCSFLATSHRTAPPVHAVIVVFCHVRTDFCKLKVCRHSTSKFYYATYLGLFFVVELTSIGLITSLYLRVKKKSRLIYLIGEQAYAGKQNLRTIIQTTSLHILLLGIRMNWQAKQILSRLTQQNF